MRKLKMLKMSTLQENFFFLNGNVYLLIQKAVQKDYSGKLPLKVRWHKQPTRGGKKKDQTTEMKKG